MLPPRQRDHVQSRDVPEILRVRGEQLEAPLKRLRRKGDSIALEPANPAHKTRIFGPDRVRIQGKLVGLMRRY